MADTTGTGKQLGGAPTITLDTSAINDLPSQVSIDPEITSAVTFLGDLKNSLVVPDSSRQREGSVDSQSTTGSHTVVGSPLGATERSYNVTNIQDFSNDRIFQPDEETPAELFQAENNPFGVTLGHLSKLIPRKNLNVFYQLNGLAGLERGLRTNLKNGLSFDEESLQGVVFWEDIKSVSPEGIDTRERKPLRVSTTQNMDPPKTAAKAFSDRKRIFGDNQLPERKPKRLWQLAWEALQDKILILLCVAAVVSLALGIYTSVTKKAEEGAKIDWVEGVAIIVAITIVVMVGAVNDWQKERQFKKLNKKKEDRLVKVVRSGTTFKVSVWDVFPGDIMILEPGDILPCDGIFIDGHNVSCDESSATGESDLQKKTPGAIVWQAVANEQNTKKMDPFIISGARVSEGFGTFLVTAVGVNSSHGKLMMSLNEETDVTPLQYKLNRLGSYIAKLGSGAGLLLFIVLFIEFLTRLNKPGEDGQPKDTNTKAQDFIKILITAVTIVVVAVPEGLPLAVTLALAFATKRMTKDNNLVRHLQSCETMGNATVICSDKTGTLTQNVMTVVAGTFGRGSVCAGDKDKLPSKETEDIFPVLDTIDSSAGTSGGPVSIPIYDLHEKLDRELQFLLKESIAINSTAFEGEEKGKKAFIGSKTETALLDFAKRCFSLANLAKEHEDAIITQLFPFDSKKKCMGVVVKRDGRFRMYIKGASEIVLRHCSHVISDPLASLEASDLTEEDRSALNTIISQYASTSLRTIGMAYREFEHWPPEDARKVEDDPNQAVFDDVFKSLTWISVVGIQDPVRDGVPQAVKDCERASVRVLMVTGDNIETAKAIAKECGILKENGIAIEGPGFRKLSEVELQEILPKLCVVARSSPEDKKTLVNSFRANGHVVAVTGDGSNDGPALKAADVGFSMGITGTEVAKEASDIILMDDNFSSIVKALAWGRTINDAVKKFLQFQITVNIVAVILTFITAVSSDDEESVLNAVQLLWVNLIMDTFAALALATDPPAGSLLDRKPETREAALISITMWKTILGQTIYQLAVTLTMYFVGKKFIPYDHHDDPHIADRQFNTLIFNTFVWMQIFDALNCRRIDNSKNIFEGFWRNRFFMGIMCIMIGGQTIIVSFGGAAFVVEPIRGSHWGISIIVGFISLPIGFLIRCIPDPWVRVDKLIKKLLPRALSRWWANHKTKKEEKARARGTVDIKADEDFSKEWGRVHQKVYDDLALYKLLRGGRRLKTLKNTIRKPKEIFHRSRSNSRQSVLPALIAPGAMAGGVGGGVTTTDRRSINSRDTLPTGDNAV